MGDQPVMGLKDNRTANHTRTLLTASTRQLRHQLHLQAQLRRTLCPLFHFLQRTPTLPHRRVIGQARALGTTTTIITTRRMVP